MSSEPLIDLEQLTTKQRYWYNHLEQARDSDTSLAGYARDQNLDIKALYHYQSVLRQKGIVKHKSNFTRITRASIIEQTQVGHDLVIICLANGNRLEVPASAVEINTLLQTVAAL